MLTWRRIRGAKVHKGKHLGNVAETPVPVVGTHGGGRELNW